MALLKKVLLGVAGLVSLGSVGNSFANSFAADVSYDISTAASQDDIVKAATDFVVVLQSKPGFENLALDSVNGYAGNFVVNGDTNIIKSISLTKVGVTVSGVPLFNIYSPVIDLSADISSDCKTVSNEVYTVYKTNPVLDGNFHSDLVASGHVLFTSLLANSNLKDYCPK